jgi:arginyl-tRNA--protein-N-Asp/Glu arginylyltransferase
MTELEALKFFQTPDHPCSYLPSEQATTVFADPDAIIDTQLYTQLSQLGLSTLLPCVYGVYSSSDTGVCLRSKTSAPAGTNA